VGDDSNGVRDIFVHDLQTGATWRVSISNTNFQGNGDSQEPSLSENGGAVAFYSFASNLVSNDTNSVADVFVYDGD
jgi:Tol biopolymer transport system component